MSCLDCHCHPTPHQPLIMRWGIMELTTASYHLRGPPFGVVLSSLEKMAAMHNYSGILVALQQLIVFLIVSVTCFIGRLYSAAHCQFLLGVSLASNGRCFLLGTLPRRYIASFQWFGRPRGITFSLELRVGVHFHQGRPCFLFEITRRAESGPCNIK